MGWMIQHIEAAARNAAQLAEHARFVATNKRIACQKRAARNAHGTGLRAALIERIPVGPKNAIQLPEIRALIADIPYQNNGLAGALTDLIAENIIKRKGRVRHYAYYKDIAK